MGTRRFIPFGLLELVVTSFYSNVPYVDCTTSLFWLSAYSETYKAVLIYVVCSLNLRRRRHRYKLSRTLFVRRDHGESQR